MPAASAPDFTQLADLIPQLVWMTDPGGNHLYFNRRWTEFTGLSVTESLGPDVWNRTLHPDDQARARERWEQSLESGAFYEIEYRFRRHDGKYRWFLGQAQPLRNAEGRITTWFGTCTDIHERRQTRRALEASERRFELMAELVPQIVWTSTPEAGGNDYLNRRWYEYTGLTEAESLGKHHWAVVLHPDDQQPTFERWQHCVATGEFFEIEYRLRGADGQYRWFLGQARPVNEPHGKNTKWFGTCTEIDEQMQLRAEVEDKARQLQALTGALAQIIYITDARTLRPTYLSPQWFAYTGQDPNDPTIMGPEQRWLDAVNQEDLAAGASLRPAADGTPLEVELRLRRHDGSWRWHLSRSTFVTDAAGQPLTTYGTSTDIHDLKTTQATLREREQELDTLANNIPQLAWMTDETGYIFWYNRRWYEYTGTTLEQMRGWGWQGVHHPEYVDGVTERFRQAVEAGQPWQDTFPLRGADGQYRWFLSRAQPIRDEATGRVVRWFGTNTDVTEQLQLQEQLRSAYEDLEVKVTFRTLELEREVQALRARLGT